MTAEERLTLDGYEGVKPILFYRPRDEYGWASNFSRHPIWLPHPFTGENTRYETTEHRYQAMKTDSAGDHDYVNLGVLPEGSELVYTEYRPDQAARPSTAKDRGRVICLRDGWGNDYGDLCWYVMIECLWAKVTQHADVFAWLTWTGDDPMYEDSPTDDIWGWRYREAHTGKNLLGRAWMQVRADIEVARSR